MSRRTFPILALATLAVTLTACGDDATGPGDPQATLDLVYERVAPTPVSGLYVLRDATGTPERLSTAATLAGQPSTSADGSLIAFAGTTLEAADPLDLWLMRADGSERRRIPVQAGTEVAPALSPDGRRVAFIRIGDDDVSRLFVANVDGTNERQLAATLADAGTSRATPAWSPDGQRIAFAAGAPGALAVWIIDADGTDPVRITTGGAMTDFDPAWSPDGQRLAFVRTHAPRRADLMVIDLVTRAQRTLVSTGSNRQPAWSPDGTRIAFASTVDGGDDQELYTIRPDGAGLVRLTTNTEDERRPAWLVRGR